GPGRRPSSEQGSRETTMHGPDPPLEPTPHLAPALTAVILGIAFFMGFGVYARSLERRAIVTLATHEAIIHRDGGLFPLTNQGAALQTAAFEAGGLLPIYGSSEMTLHGDYNRPFHATNLFRERPTGFAVFPTGMAGTTCLIIQQKLAAAGP